MSYETEKTITVKFYADGKVSVEAFGYAEALDPQFVAGHANNLETLQYKQACLADCHELIRQLGEVESISPKDQASADSAINRIKLT